MVIIYHCPYCGGAAPRSNRDSLFHVVAREEEERLAKRLSGISTIRGALRKLGKPDHDNPRGMGSQSPSRARRGPTTQWFRTLRFEGLSKVANVCFVERDDGRASWFVQGKHKKKPARRGRKT